MTAKRRCVDLPPRGMSDAETAAYLGARSHGSPSICPRWKPRVFRQSCRSSIYAIASLSIAGSTHRADLSGHAKFRLRLDQGGK